MNPQIKTFLFGFVTALILSVTFITKCTPEQSTNTEIRKVQKQIDSAKVEVKKKDTVRLQIVERWRTIYKDRVLTAPCDSILPVIVHVTDSIIVADSSAIATRDEVIRLDSVVISKMAFKIGCDSVTIDRLDRKVRRGRIINWISFGAGVLVGAAVR